jgi:hypothetical protein
MGKTNITIRVAGNEKTFGDYTRGKAIKAMCRDCMGGAVEEVRNCSAPECPLYAFRPYASKKLVTPV